MGRFRPITAPDVEVAMFSFPLYGGLFDDHAASDEILTEAA